MPGTLYIVATPIGNLEDITFRAVRILKEVDLIACEDTRQTAKLLNHYEIKKPLTSYFDHNKGPKGDMILRRLEEGENVALVSDAGTPGISDPGYNLIVSAIQKNIAVVPIPGASASSVALSASGLPTDRFLFLGFLPQKDGKKRKVLESVAHEEATLIIYESPYRVKKTLELILSVLGDRECSLAHELTKIHEFYLRGKMSDILASPEKMIEKGEWILLISGKTL